MGGAGAATAGLQQQHRFRRRSQWLATHGWLTRDRMHGPVLRDLADDRWRSDLAEGGRGLILGVIRLQNHSSRSSMQHTATSRSRSATHLPRFCARVTVDARGRAPGSSPTTRIHVLAIDNATRSGQCRRRLRIDTPHQRRRPSFEPVRALRVSVNGSWLDVAVLAHPAQHDGHRFPQPYTMATAWSRFE